MCFVQNFSRNESLVHALLVARARHSGIFRQISRRLPVVAPAPAWATEEIELPAGLLAASAPLGGQGAPVLPGVEHRGEGDGGAALEAVRDRVLGVCPEVLCSARAEPEVLGDLGPAGQDAFAVLEASLEIGDLANERINLAEQRAKKLIAQDER